MVYKKPRRKFAKRYRKFRRKFIGANKMRPSRQLNPFPDNYLCKLRYSQVVPVNFAAGAWNYQKFRLNSLYDPDLTGLGHQPRGFDELSVIYSKYLVLGAKIKIKFWNTSAIDTYVGFNIRKDTSAPTTFEDWTEGRFGSSKILKSNNTDLHYKQQYVKMNHFFGKKMQLSDPEVCVAVTNNPTETCNYIIGVNDVALSGSGSITAEVEIVYDTVFTQRVYLSAS